MENHCPLPALWLSCAAVRLLILFPSLLHSFLRCKLTKPLPTLLYFPNFLSFMLLCPESFPSPLSSTKWGFQDWREQLQPKPCKSSVTPLCLTERSRWETLARKILGHPAWAHTPATASELSLPEMAHFHLEPSKHFLTSSHLLESWYIILTLIHTFFSFPAQGVFWGFFCLGLVLFVFF